MRMEDVAPADTVSLDPATLTTIEVRTFGSMEVRIRLGKVGEDHWALLSADYHEDVKDPDAEEPPAEGEDAETAAEKAEEPAEQKEAGELREKFDGWAFKIGESSVTSLTKRMADLTKAKPAPEPAAAPEPDAAPPAAPGDDAAGAQPEPAGAAPEEPPTPEAPPPAREGGAQTPSAP
jgi:hypothetical protein